MVYIGTEMCKIKFIKMRHYVNLSKFSQVSEHFLIVKIWMICSHFAYLSVRLLSLCLRVSFFLQMCIISSSYGYDLEGFVCASVTDS